MLNRDVKLNQPKTYSLHLLFVVEAKKNLL